ncbi:hypothetical protein [Sphingobium cupriresistens]|uniref:NAD(P)/FAD-dependent oxidoreductase n=1 Tax=Sphingobium cupriresistens TaxID=1132417 RepID=A0A8G2DZX5_9SPHN|nr:hypothetical protein [Sphingobium cupriresistens]RYM14946.1 hypothetical protein EWH12_00605 [Sphingobium cupriresistens]
MTIIAIRGSGIAATGCAHILAGAGFRVAIEERRRPSVPTIMLSDPALRLIRGVFDRPDLFADQPRVKRRLVAWGGAPVMLPHDAALASEEQVQAALPSIAAFEAGPIDFTIHAASPAPLGDMHIFGERNAIAAKVTLRDPACIEEARIEAVAAGWLYLVPAEPGFGWLLGVGGSVDGLLGKSALIAPVVDAIGATSTAFPAAPRLQLPLHGDDWLACGTAALGFDPICGDGAAQSVREAILAAAVVIGMVDGGDRAALLTHYRSMLIAAMRRHLLLCAQFYANGGQGDWWRVQHDALMEGHHICTGLLARLPEPRFLLDGFRLAPRQVAA